MVLKNVCALDGSSLSIGRVNITKECDILSSLRVSFINVLSIPITNDVTLFSPALPLLADK